MIELNVIILLNYSWTWTLTRQLINSSINFDINTVSHIYNDFVICSLSDLMLKWYNFTQSDEKDHEEMLMN